MLTVQAGVLEEYPEIAVTTVLLERREPGIVPTLNRRAAAWCEQHGALEAAIEYAFTGGDLDHAARLLARCAVQIRGLDRRVLAGAVPPVAIGKRERRSTLGAAEQPPLAGMRVELLHPKTGRVAADQILGGSTT